MKIGKCFNNAKIYIIKFINNDNHIYIGSTIRSLKTRFAGHKNCKSQTSISRYVNDTYDNNWNLCNIELYMDYPCNSNRELIKKEYQIINKFARNKKFNVLNINGNKSKK